MISDQHLNDFMDLLSGQLLDGSENDDESENKVVLFMKKRANRLLRKRKESEKQKKEVEVVKVEEVATLPQVEEKENSENSDSDSEEKENTKKEEAVVSLN